jgi:serine/threonine protein kinase
MDRILQYEIAQKLGEGKNGEAYLALDSGLQRAVVVKTFKEDSRIGEENRRSAFLELMERFRALNSPGIARFYSLEQTESCWIAVREYIEGQTIAELIRPEPLAYKRWLETALQLARTLKVVHDAGLVHGNITAANVFVTSDKSISLTDYAFGAVWTGCGDRAGNVYLAPELVGKNECTVAGDLYSLGVVLFVLLTGRVPEQSEEKIAEACFDGLSEASVPGVARLLLNRMMAPDPIDRFGSVDELILTLQGMISLGAEPEAVETRRKWHPTPRQYLMLALLFLLLIILWLAITSHPR